MNNTLIQIDQLSKKFVGQNDFALNDIAVSIPKGKITALVGPDGSGKTTLIRLIAALLKPSSGTIVIDGYDTIKGAEFIHYLSGYMPQKFGLYEDLSVEQNLELFANLRNITGNEKKETLEKLLTFSRLSPFKKRLAKNLSGGMKQKLGLACALIKKPTLLLLDEPSVGVDPVSRHELWKIVESLVDESITVLWSTTYLEEAERCDYTLVLNEGKMLYAGVPKEFIEHLGNRVKLITPNKNEKRKLLIQLIKDENVLDGVIQGDHIRVLLKEKASLPDSIQYEDAPPRFEDVFIDKLGGGPKQESELAKRRPNVEEKITASIETENLTKKFGKYTAVDRVSLKVKKGEVFGLLGPNGAGKTTTFKMLCGLLTPTSGKARVNNLDLQKAPAKARARIGYMAQKFSLYGTLSVMQNLNFFAGIYKLENAKKKEAIDSMIEIFNLKNFLHASAESLPLGYKQRLSLACANMHHPDVLFLDEPTSGVDPTTRREFWNHINGLVEKGVTILITTHFMDEAEYCDRIALIFQGKIVKIDTPDLLKDSIKSKELPNPSLEDVFVQMVKNSPENENIAYG